MLRDSTKALLFDLGGVVIDISFQKALEVWGHYADIEPNDLKSLFIPGEAYERHERGEIGANDYFASLRKAFRADLTDEQFREGWNAIFLGEFTETVSLLNQLKPKMPLYAFSNINATHKQFGVENYSATLALFDKVFFSSDIGMRKPELRAFDFVASEVGFDPSDIIFFDDTEENVRAARAAGMQAVLVTSPDDVASAVAAFL